MSAPELPPGTPAILTAGEVARIHRVDPKTVTKWAADEKVASIVMPGGPRRYPAAQFAEMLAVTGWPL